MDRTPDPLAIVIAGLPLRDSVDVDNEATLLRTMCGVALFNGHKRMRPAPPAARQKQLEGLYSQARKLSAHLNRMSVHTLAELCPPGVRHPLSVADLLDDIAVRANEALKTPKEQTFPASAPEQVVQVCAKFFEKLTGKEAKRQWEHPDAIAFQEFVAGVFEAFGIKRSAEHYVRKAEKVDVIGVGSGMTIREVPRTKK